MHAMYAMYGNPHESLTARRAYASVPRLGFNGLMMTRHDSQQSGRLVGDVRAVDRFPPACDGSPLGVGWMRMKRDDDSHDRLEQRSRCIPPQLFRTEKQLTAPADRPVRAPAHAVAFSTGVAAGYDRNGPGSRPASNCAQNPPPALAAIQTHCCSDHRHAWRCNADPDVDLEKKEVQDDTQRTARARREPGCTRTSHTPRASQIDSDWPPALAGASALRASD